MAGRLQGKTVLVTAAAQGMGRAAVLAFAREGANVIASDLKDELLLDLPPTITKRQLDVLDDTAVQAFVENIGAVNVLFNCAGYVAHGTILECSTKYWDFSFDLNVRSMFVLT
jgi:NAD(P)-dependent dehydrogenase (short-subunit alcohol dehydrogenase family)